MKMNFLSTILIMVKSLLSKGVSELLNKGKSSIIKLNISDQRGFNIIELLLTVAIASIIITIISPHFHDWNTSQQLSKSIRKLRSVVQMSRQAAIKYRATSVIKLNTALPGGGRCPVKTAGKSYLSFVRMTGSTPADPTYSAATDKVIACGNFSDDVGIINQDFCGGYYQSLVFSPSGAGMQSVGGGVSSAYFTLRNLWKFSVTPGSPEDASIYVSPSGSIRILSEGDSSTCN